MLRFLFAFFFLLHPALLEAQEIHIRRPMSPPTWALLQRELLRANAAACAEFYERYFDERGFLLCVERWGGDDGPDDAIENCLDWPILHALGASDKVLHLYKKAWEGNLRQYTLARTTHVPFAKDGMYYKEFPVMFDWLHNGEGLTVFSMQGLSDPEDAKFRARMRRFAGFYLNEDPGAANYDPKHKIIRSLFNGSRGPLLRKATALDWAGDPIEVENRFTLGHGERNYEEMLAHFEEYNDIIGDHPLNLLSTALATNAYMLGHEEKYKAWVLEYVDAWRERMLANDGIIPTNVGLDGKVGSAAGGKWYGGVYGWGFTVKDPRTRAAVHRNQASRGFHGFMNAYLLSGGEDKYLDPWRHMIDKVNAQCKTMDGVLKHPSMYGDKGWYHYLPGKYKLNARELYLLSMKAQDRDRVGSDPFFEYLEGKNPKFAEEALRRDLERVRSRVEAMRKDKTTPDTRLSDDTLRYSPASVDSMMELCMGAAPPGRVGMVLHARLRYFDPERRRAGLPEGVAALIEQMSGEGVTVTLVNTDQLHERRVIVQAGAYGEHKILSAHWMDDKEGVTKVHAGTVAVRLAPGAGATLQLRMMRNAQPPRLRFPW